MWQKAYANNAEGINKPLTTLSASHNSTRLHSTLGNVSPDAFEREMTSK